jgi:hypothetical protein
MVPVARYEPLILGWWDKCYTTVLSQPSDKGKYFAVFCLTLSSVLGYEPFILGLWDQCPTDTQPSKVRRVFSIFSLAPVSIGKIWTHNLGIMSRAFYYCCTQAQPSEVKRVFCLYSHEKVPVARFEPLIIGFWVWPFYHCATETQIKSHEAVCHKAGKRAKASLLRIYRYPNPFLGTLTERDGTVRLTSL